MDRQLIVREANDGRPAGERRIFEITRPADLIRIADLGMRLEEAKAILAGL